MVLYSMRTRTRHNRRKAYNNVAQIYEQSGRMHSPCAQKQIQPESGHNHHQNIPRFGIQSDRWRPGRIHIQQQNVSHPVRHCQRNMRAQSVRK